MPNGWATPAAVDQFPLRIGQFHAVGSAARTGDQLACGRVAHVAERVHHYERRNHGSAGEHDGGGADPALHRLLHAEKLADRGAGARAYRAFLHRIVGGGGRGRLAHLPCRPHTPPGETEIVQYGAWHDRHYAVRGLESNAAMFEKAAHA